MTTHEMYPLYEQTEIIQNRRKKVLQRNERTALLKSIFQTLLLTGLFVLAFMSYFHFRIVDGNGMYPAVSDGDLVLGANEKQYKKNDIIYYQHNGTRYIGRVIAKSGDRVEITEEGSLYVNGTIQTGEIAFPTYPPENWNGTITVPENAVFVLGDFRTQTLDSRDFGCIPIENVEMKVITLIRHRRL